MTLSTSLDKKSQKTSINPKNKDKNNMSQTSSSPTTTNLVLVNPKIQTFIMCRLSLQSQCNLNKSRLTMIQLLLTLAVLVQAQKKPDFISVDCGIGDTRSYTDETTGRNYTSDDNFIGTGVSRNISPEHNTTSLERQFWNVRSFPAYKRNCYSFNTYFSNPHGVQVQYLVRARFMYGNYDGKNFLPKFDLYLGTSWWDSIKFQNASTVITKEVIYASGSDHIHVCLCNTNKGTPFISVLELTFFPGFKYLGSDLEHFARFDIGSQDGKIVRYPDDGVDRIWTPYNLIEWTQLSTRFEVDVKSVDDSLPSRIMRTAATPACGGNSIYLPFRFNSSASAYSVYLYFAEVQKLNHLNHQLRKFDVLINGIQGADPVVEHVYLETFSSGAENINAEGSLEVLLKRSNGSTLPPILNAIEIYIDKDLTQHETNEREYAAINRIKSNYRIKRNWQGDPCNPPDYYWEGLICRNGDGSDKPIITSLNLSSSGLSGNITIDIFDLKSIQHLDLSHNNLTGALPDFLSQLNSLQVLMLEGNCLSRTIPQELLEKSQKGLLNFSYDGNPNPWCLGSRKKRKIDNKVVVPIVASLCGAFIMFAVISFWIFKRRQSNKAATSSNKPSLEFPLIKDIDSNKQQFTYAEVLGITNNFERVLGKGGFGTVYHGYIGTIQVAVKVLSPSAHGYLQFQAEEVLLTRVHHKCLTALIGYCDEGSNVALIYEYMANGDLAEHLSGKSGKFLGWKQRLQIALDAAEGLEYLHDGCKPPIIHRDIKPQNILVNEKMRGKLADFGLSRIFSHEDDTHISTIVAGTLGYLDPEYYMSNRLNEKSDVFSFGIVLLQIITGRPAIDKKTEEKSHITQWLHSILPEGEIQDILDSRLRDEFSRDSAKKVLDTAMACVAPTSIERPTMTQVVMELKQSLKSEMTPTYYAQGIVSNCSVDGSFNEISGESSLAR